MEKNQTTTEMTFPQTLDTGMKVTAVCMGREVGNYVVTHVGKRNAIMEVEADPDGSRLIYVKRAAGENGLVTVFKNGLNIQATDYFVKPYARA